MPWWAHVLAFVIILNAAFLAALLAGPIDLDG